MYPNGQHFCSLSPESCSHISRICTRSDLGYTNLNIAIMTSVIFGDVDLTSANFDGVVRI